MPEDGTARAPDPLVGSVLAGRYDIRRLLGEGGMGRVYEGRQRALDRPVAVKCIHPHLLATEHMVVRFMEEARVASQLVHPNIVKIYDFGRSDPSVSPTFFLVMELLSGPDLGSVITGRGALPIARSYSILKQVLSALGEAHARGVTHRDAKPDNVILEPTVGGGERVKIIDFGIAKVHGAPGVTSAGQFVGTPQYMPPEQIRGENAEVSSDLYAVGVTMFQMLTGELPFQGDSVMEILEQQLYAVRPDPRTVASGASCPTAVAEVCLRALDIEPARRYSSADAFAEALDEAVAEVLPPRNRRSPFPPAIASSGKSARSGGETAADVRVPSSWPPPMRPRSSMPTERAAVPSGQPFPPSPSSYPPRISATTGSSAPPPRSGTRIADITVAERIEYQAERDVCAGRLDAAAAELRRGLAIGRCWLEAGDLELGGAALTVFGRKLGAVLRDAGRLDESERVLRSALEQTEPDEAGRAHVLAELSTTLGERGRVGDAEACRMEALRIAGTAGDRELTARLRRLAQSLALAVGAHGAAGTAGPRAEPSLGSAPASRPSEWRFKRELGEDAESFDLRRRR
jgi:serine/threonine protein kinase